MERVLRKNDLRRIQREKIDTAVFLTLNVNKSKGMNQLCQILGKRIKDIVSEQLTNDSEFELVVTTDKLNAVIEGDFMAFHQACERELQRRDEQYGDEYELNRRLAIGLARQRVVNEELMQELEDLKAQNEVSGQAFELPFAEVKKYLSYMDYHTDSILDPDYNAQMHEFGWRRLLQNYINRLGHLPIQGAPFETPSNVCVNI